MSRNVPLKNVGGNINLLDGQKQMTAYVLFGITYQIQY